MKKVYIAVMDYTSSSIKMHEVNMKEDYSDDDVEEWLLENTDYKITTCYYMFSEEEIEIQSPSYMPITMNGLNGFVKV